VLAIFLYFIGYNADNLFNDQLNKTAEIITQTLDEEE
jgi:hypothetical protein